MTCEQKLERIEEVINMTDIDAEVKVLIISSVLGIDEVR
jgi:hypothetical protein